MVASDDPSNSGRLSFISVTTTVRSAVPVSDGVPLSLASMTREYVLCVSRSSCVDVKTSPVVAVEGN